MSEPEKKTFFIKFKIDKDSDGFESMLISEDKAKIDEWDATSSLQEDEEPVEARDRGSEFQAVARDFEKTMEAFQTSVPFIMQALPFFRKITDNSQIRGFVQAHGERLQGGHFETYQMDIEHSAELTRRLVDSNALAAGIGRIPSLF